MAVERANAEQQEASLEMQVQYLIKYYPYYEQYYQQLALQEAEKAQQAQIAQAQAQRAAQSQATASQASEQNTPAKADKAKTAMETLQALQAQHAQQVQQPQLQLQQQQQQQQPPSQQPQQTQQTPQMPVPRPPQPPQPQTQPTVVVPPPPAPVVPQHAQHVQQQQQQQQQQGYAHPRQQEGSSPTLVPGPGTADEAHARQGQSPMNWQQQYGTASWNVGGYAHGGGASCASSDAPRAWRPPGAGGGEHAYGSAWATEGGASLAERHDSSHDHGCCGSRCSCGSSWDWNQNWGWNHGWGEEVDQSGVGEENSADPWTPAGATGSTWDGRALWGGYGPHAQPGARSSYMPGPCFGGKANYGLGGGKAGAGGKAAVYGQSPMNIPAAFAYKGDAAGKPQGGKADWGKGMPNSGYYGGSAGSASGAWDSGAASGSQSRAREPVALAPGESAGGSRGSEGATERSSGGSNSARGNSNRRHGSARGNGHRHRGGSKHTRHRGRSRSGERHGSAREDRNRGSRDRDRRRGDGARCENSRGDTGSWQADDAADDEPSICVHVGGLAYSATAEDVRERFSEVGEVESVDLKIDRDTGRSKGYAYVTFVDETAAEEAARQLDGCEIRGRPVRLGLGSAGKSRERRSRSTRSRGTRRSSRH